MKQIFSSLLTLALISGCSSRAPVLVAGGVRPISPSLVMIGKNGLAHACAVDGYILTAAHVAFARYPTGAVEAQGYVYTQGPRKGTVYGYVEAISRDLAVMVNDGGDEPVYRPRAAVGPSIGDEVSWVQYNLTDNPLHQETARGKITEVGPGHFVFSPEPLPGASGGCLLDSSGNVLGVLIWTIGVDPANARGIGATITGDWWPTPPQ